jgi:hypothetical protein
MTYALNRKPEWFRIVQWVIDATHFPGVLMHFTSRDNHVCLPSTLRFVSSGRVFWLIVQAHFALLSWPQVTQVVTFTDVWQNSQLALVQKQCALMGQLTFLP